MKDNFFNKENILDNIFSKNIKKIFILDKKCFMIILKMKILFINKIQLHFHLVNLKQKIKIIFILINKFQLKNLRANIVIL